LQIKITALLANEIQWDNKPYTGLVTQRNSTGNKNFLLFVLEKLKIKVFTKKKKLICIEPSTVMQMVN
jgi:hypothetical protein